MDGLSFLIPFVFPGVFIKMIYNRFFPSAREDDSKYDEIVQSFIISTVILMINAGIIKVLYGVDILSKNSFTAFVETSNNLIWFFIITLILSGLGVPIYRLIVDYFYVWVINIYRDKMHLARESSHLSPWNVVFENKKFCLDNRPTGVFKGNELVTIGYLECYPAAGNKKKDFVLINTQLFKELYNADNGKEPKDRLFKLIDKEYYNFENDTHIKFYNNVSLLKYLREKGLIDPEVS